MNNLLYPPSPTNINPSLLAPSPEFKAQVSKVIGSIVAFFIVYLLLVIAAFALAVGCFYGGIMIIVLFPRFITLMIGLGMMAMGLSVIFFLIKFIFAVSKNENPSRVRVYEEDQPKLFAFIRRLSEETKTDFPKKIFVSTDVNACVFYNSSFWSMFLPVRKNLEIGLGLVNSINLSEFKAVVAHEFGHFSQRSMRLGSFTYNVNQVIYNMLFNNNSYAAFLNSWASVSGYLAFFAQITIKIAQAIQWVLRRMYEFINKNYFGLSREMEFHADAVASTVAGGNNLVTALSSIQLANSCYNAALNNANGWIKEKKQTKNIFENQLTIFQSIAKEYQLPVNNGLPSVSFQFIQSFSQSRINYKNQWASHPSLEERKLHLDKLGIDVAPDEETAWHVFENVDALQEQLTENLYRLAKLEDGFEKCDGIRFEEEYKKERSVTQLPLVYKGFYDKRFVDVNDWDFEKLTGNPTSLYFDGMFNEENGQLQSCINSLESDIEIVKAIRDKHIDVKTFDFDGVKHENTDCDAVIDQLTKDRDAIIEKQQLLDKEAFKFFYHYPGADKEQMVADYKHFRELFDEYKTYSDLANKVMEILQPFYQGQVGIEMVKASVAGLKIKEEKKLKEFFTVLLEQDLFLGESNKDLAAKMRSFIGKDYAYFAFDSFINAELSELSELTIKVADVLNSRKLICYKKVLEDQLGTFNPADVQESLEEEFA